MVLCLAGINTVDLFNLKKTDYYDGIIHYQRAKTKKFRSDGAYIEMKVPSILKSIFEKYLSHDDNDEYLFSFHKRHSTSDSFSSNVNAGIRKICDSLQIKKEDRYCVYTFRHTWATIAQNDCSASIDEVAFAMNHSSSHRVTRGYIKIDFSPAWELNEKVIDMVFFSDKKSKSAENKSEKFARFSAKYMIRGQVFFRGKLLGELQDIGFNNVDEVINSLIKFIPDDIPVRSILQFRITNVDKDQTVVYERMRGKGC